MNHRSEIMNFHRCRLGRLLGAVALTALLTSGAAHAAGVSTKPTSSCVACHTDVEKLKAEAGKVPPPAASALQAGKG